MMLTLARDSDVEWSGWPMWTHFAQSSGRSTIPWWLATFEVAIQPVPPDGTGMLPSGNPVGQRVV